MDLMGEDVTARDRSLVEVIEVVHVHISVGETPSWCNMEVANNLVDSYMALNATSLSALGVEPLSIVLSLALLDILASLEGP